MVFGWRVPQMFILSIDLPTKLQIKNFHRSRKQLSHKHLRDCGYETFCHVSKDLRDKLTQKSKKCIFLGYCDCSKMGYHLWDLEAKKVIESNDVYFNKDKMHKKPIPTEDITRVAGFKKMNSQLDNDYLLFTELQKCRMIEWNNKQLRLSMC